MPKFNVDDVLGRPDTGMDWRAKPNVYSRPEILNMELQDARASGDTQNTGYLQAEMKAGNVREAKPKPRFNVDDVLNQVQPSPQPKPSGLDFSLNTDKVAAVGQGIKDAAGALVRSGTGIVSNLMRPFEAMIPGGEDGSSGHAARTGRVDSRLRAKGYNPDSATSQVVKTGADVLVTLPVGGALGAIAGKAGLPALQTALRTGGFRTGLPAAPLLSRAGAGQQALRAISGATVGGASTAMVGPEHAGTGAIIGGALPGSLAAVGNAFRGAGRIISGPSVTPEVQKAVKSARDLGYVMPPSQAKPTFMNRAMEGFAGKLTTSQNASAMNQDVTNQLAKKSIGANELSDTGLQQVRDTANKAYDELGRVGAFVADANFHQALDAAGASTAAMQKNFPELVNNEVDELIGGLKSRGQFEAQPTIEAIKQFRANAAANKSAQDPAKKALGRTQNKIANALEDLIDRNLQQTGDVQLLDNYRAARTTLAKVYDVEKAMNKGSGNIDAAKLANALGRGRPLTGELRDIAEFSSRFPKATQTVDKMGSLPQTSPLDWIPAGAMSFGTGNPAMMASLLARPAARKAVLSGVVQNRLGRAATSKPLPMLSDEIQGLLYRSTPVAFTSR